MLVQYNYNYIRILFKRSPIVQINPSCENSNIWAILIELSATVQLLASITIAKYFWSQTTGSCHQRTCFPA